MTHQICRLALAALLGFAGTAAAMSTGGLPVIEGEGLAAVPPGFHDLSRKYPGVRAYTAEERIRTIYGKPMTAAETPDDAAAQWLVEHSTAFGMGELDLEQVWVAEISMGKFTVFGYQQYIDGLPVEYGIGRVLVLNGFGDDPNRVVYAAGLFAPRPEGGFGLPFVQPGAAVASVQGMINFEHLPVWTEPELVIFQGDDTRIDPVLTWKFVGEEPDLENRERYYFFVNAGTGELVHVRNGILDIDVIGHARGMASPGTLPDIVQNPPEFFGLPHLRVAVSGGNFSYSDRFGDFVIPHGGSNPVTVTSTLTNGRWATITDNAGPVQNFSGTFTPGVHGFMSYNTSPTQFNTAQVNAFIHTGLIHDYIRDRTSWTGMDFQCLARVNINSSCNAFFDGSSINFYRAAGGCNNTAYSSVVAHEYGHYIVNRLGLSQGAFGEGYSDTCSMMLYDDPIIGRWFTTSGGHVRHPIQANVQYPCSGGVHHCGQLLGGVVWRIRLAFGNAYGSQTGLTLAQQLHVDWSMITVGGSGSNSAHPATAIEWLVVDDDDGDISNGTPHYNLICASFGAHSIDCPPLPDVVISFPTGRPRDYDALTVGQAETFGVRIEAGAATPDPSTARLFYDVNESGSYQAASLTHLGGDDYTATLPGVDCDDTVNYFIQVQDTNGGFHTSPSSAPAETHWAGALFFADAFATDKGWVVGAPDDDATTGHWTRMKPEQTQNGSGQVAQPGSGFLGLECYVTDGRGGGLGDYDVDNGKTTLFTPILDLTQTDDPVVSYMRWYSNHTGANPYNDIFVVDISNDGGVTWTNLEVVGPTGNEVEGGWYYAEHRVADFVTPTQAVVIRFVASDYDPQALVEACVDDFRVTWGGGGSGCDDDCYADCNDDGEINTLDFLCFLNLYTAGDPAADCNDDGEINTLDFLCFLNAYTAGCP